MSADQAPPELTTRDVLAQVDRRIDLVETDIRKLDSKFDARFNALDAKFDAKFDALVEKIDTRFRHLTTTMIAVTGVLVATAGACVAYLKV